jgi:hypothetical protein
MTDLKNNGGAAPVERALAGLSKAGLIYARACDWTQARR